MKMSEMVPSDWLCLSVWLTVFASIVPTMGLTTLRGLAGTEVESKLYTDSLSAWYVTLTSSPLDFLLSLFYRTEDCSKIILKTCVFPSACKITYFCVLVRFFTLTFVNYRNTLYSRFLFLSLSFPPSPSCFPSFTVNSNHTQHKKKCKSSHTEG